MIFTIAAGIYLGLWLFCGGLGELIEFALEHWIWFAIICFFIFII